MNARHIAQLLIGLAACGALLAVPWFLTEHEASRIDLLRAVHEAEQAGIPMDEASFLRTPSVPANQDAALLIDSLKADIKSWIKAGFERDPIGFAEKSAQYPKLLAAIRRATALRFFSWRPMDTHADQLTTLSDLYRGLRVLVIGEARLGHWSTAKEYLRWIERTIDWFREGHGIDCFLNYPVRDAGLFGVCQPLLLESNGDPQAIAFAREVLSRPVVPFDLRRMYPFDLQQANFYEQRAIAELGHDKFATNFVVAARERHLAWLIRLRIAQTRAVAAATGAQQYEELVRATDTYCATHPEPVLEQPNEMSEADIARWIRDHWKYQLEHHALAGAIVKVWEVRHATGAFPSSPPELSEFSVPGQFSVHYGREPFGFVVSVFRPTSPSRTYARKPGWGGTVKDATSYRYDSRYPSN